MSLRYQGYIGAALVLGGMDCNGPHLYSIYPHGSTDKLPYVTMGEYRRGLGLRAGSVLALPSTAAAKLPWQPPRGSDRLPFPPSPTTGSGSLAAMAVFEDRYRPNLEVRRSQPPP